MSRNANEVASVKKVSAPSTNMARLDLLSLRLVVACAQTGSLTHASPLCHMSVMCASRRLRILEERLGVVLFYRRKGGLVPTDAGHIVATTSQELLVKLDQMVADAVSAPRPSGNIHENCGRAGHRQVTLSSRLDSVQHA
ncbi:MULTISPECIES: LysR family transcriptional regulator [unclassified Acidovorax]|jgi:DNA-binding transcriptional LysR family regulator|uniref:helix-turn-helix domain-containing protein n=1 Tax=unclassified Acidovorax TaxID=2684926 RepID=UPI001C47839C|nr:MULTISPECIES: LysR family transcriptional regulator [unclassified Acidovorax]MBV7430753.1 LysR family transcriptional regulator [Acidovorax sp. sif0732]MBV7451859.1 LysR family transcriptional regulator [Acidovorax sp. sif0715]